MESLKIGRILVWNKCVIVVLFHCCVMKINCSSVCKSFLLNKIQKGV